METTEGAVDSPQTSEPAVSDVSTDDLRTALGVTEQPSSAESPEPVAEGTTEIESQPGAEESAESEEDRLAKRRIRPRTAEDQQVIDLYRSQGFNGTFAEASQVIYGQQAPAVPVQPQQEQSDPFEGHAQKIESLQSEIGELETKITEATDNLETGEALEHQRQAMRKEMEIRSIHDDRTRKLEASRQREYDAHRSRAVESRDKVYEQYPVLADSNNIERKRFDSYVSQAQDNPDYAGVFESPKWPEIMAREFVMSNEPMPQHQSVPSQQNPSMGTQARVLTSGTTAQPVNSPVTPGQVAANLPNMSRDDLYALLGGDDGRRHLR